MPVLTILMMCCSLRKWTTCLPLPILLTLRLLESEKRNILWILFLIELVSIFLSRANGHISVVLLQSTAHPFTGNNFFF